MPHDLHSDRDPSTPLGAIRTMCVACAGQNGAYSQWEADRCEHDQCPLHPFRYGVMPGELVPWPWSITGLEQAI